MGQLIWYFNEGGPLMWPLLLCSVVAVAVMLERAWRLRRSALLDPAIADDVQELVERGQADAAVRKYRASPVLLGRVLARGLERHRATGTDAETALAEVGSRDLRALHKNLALLNLVAKIAPLLGLLGTVLGMILGFEALDQAAVNKANLARAIRVALITTAAGLFVAIPTVVAAAYFRARVRALQAEFEDVFLDVVTSVQRAGPPKLGEPTRTEAAAP